MTTETFAGGHGSPSTIAFYRPDQERNVLGEWTKEDGGAKPMDWEKAKNMSEAEWAKLSDAQRAGLLASVYAADADGKPGAGAALKKLQGWVESGKYKKGGSGGGGKGKGGKSDAQKKADAKKKQAEADKKRAANALKARKVRPDVVNSNHRDGYIVGESESGDTRMRWDKDNETYVIEKKDGKNWKESRRLKPEQAYNELAKETAKWYRPKVQPYLEKDRKSSGGKKTPESKSPDSRPGTPPSGADMPNNTGRVDRGDAKRKIGVGGPPRKSALTAAAEVHTGAMIALIPSAEHLESLAVDGGEDPDQLHMTEFYLGDADQYGEDERTFIIDVVSDFAEAWGPVTGNAFSVNMFNPPGTESDDGKDRDSCVVLGIGGDDVAEFHDALSEYLESEGVEYPAQHVPRIPHVTLVYTEDADLTAFTEKTGPIVFDTIRVAFGGETFDLPLGEGAVDDEDVEDTEDIEDGEDAEATTDVGTEDAAADTSGWEGLLAFDDNGELIVPNIVLDLEALAKERDVNAPGGPGHNLRNYWLRGKGAAKIRWNTGGDWTRCVTQLSKYVKDPKGLCSEYHKQATGMWPGDKRNRNMDGDTAAFDTETVYDADGAAEGGDMTSPAVEEAPRVEDMKKPANWEGVLTVEGIESGDGRMFGENALTWDELPLPLRWQKESAHGGQNDVTVSVGNIEKIWREADPSGRAGVNFIKGSGTIDLGNPDGAEVYRRMKRGYMRGNSVDVDSVKGADVELIFPESAAQPDEEAEGDVQIFDMSRMQPELTVYKKGRIRATTLVEIPAFTEARLALVADDPVAAAPQQDSEVDEVDEGDEDNSLVQAVNDKINAIVAAATTITLSDAPPREWFEEPTDVVPSGALTVTSEGRIFGYVAPLGVRHRSFQNEDVRVPMRKVDYSRFMGGETIVADGGRITTGAITMNCGHASVSPHVSAQAAAEHYDNTCSLVATVRVGENRHGVWMAGALLPDITPAQIRRIMASRLSGDWRPHLDKPGWREFVAALLVPVPGFPMARVAPSVHTSEGAIVASSVPVHFVDLLHDEEKHDMISPSSDREIEETEVTENTPQMRAQAAARRITSARVESLRGRVSAFHGTHNQKSHGRRGVGSIGSAKDRMKGAGLDGWKERKDGGFMKHNPASKSDHLIKPTDDGKWEHSYVGKGESSVNTRRFNTKEDAMKDADRVIQQDNGSGGSDKDGGGSTGKQSAGLPKKTTRRK